MNKIKTTKKVLLGASAAIALVLCGCASGVDREYLSVEPTEADVSSVVSEDIAAAENTVIENTEYSASGFTSENLSDKKWTLINGCNVSETRTTFHNGEIQIHHNGSTSAAKYWGSAYKIADGYSFGDFTFEMKFRSVHWNNDSRFFGLMFHTRDDGDKTSGYMLNYRINGQSANSCLDGTVCKDKNVNANSRNPKLNDKALHTLKVECEGNRVSHYMDDVLINNCDYGSEYSDVFSQPLTEGGFALLVSNQLIAVSSVNIVPYVGIRPEDPNPPVQTPINDNIIVNAYSHNSGLVNGPTVVCDAVDVETLNGVAAGAVRPSNVILRYDENGNVIGKDEDIIASFDDVYATIRGKVIPVVRVESVAAARHFIEYMTDVRNITDISVLSSDPSLVKTVRTALPYIRGMIYFETAEDMREVVEVTHENLAAVSILDKKLCTLENVTYVQARLGTVWALTDDLTANVYDCVNSGAYGIVSPSWKGVYEVLSTFTETTLPRTAMNVAHRGCTNGAYENSLSAVRLAVANGATHLELDAKITTDGRIMIMHDDSIAATTTGVGNLESMSYASLRNFDLTLRDSGGNTDVYLTDDNGNRIIEKIPTLEEVLDIIKDTDVILVLEIKTDKTSIVSKLNSIISRYDMYEQLVVITFNADEMLQTLGRVMPRTPAALLEGLGASIWSADDFEQIIKTLCSRNAVLDKNYVNGSSAQLNRYLRDRGIVGWYWTFNDEAAIQTAYALGYLGVTNNCAETLADEIRSVAGSPTPATSVSTGDTVKVIVKTYGGRTSETDGEVVYCRRRKGGWTVIARVLTDRGYMYTMSYTVPVAVAAAQP